MVNQFFFLNPIIRFILKNLPKKLDRGSGPRIGPLTPGSDQDRTTLSLDRTTPPKSGPVSIPIIQSQKQTYIAFS